MFTCISRFKHCFLLRCALFRGGLSRTHVESKCPELLANYCDLLLRKSPYSKKLTSEEVETRLKQVVRCPCCTHSHTQCATLHPFPYPMCHVASIPIPIMPRCTHSHTHCATLHLFPYPFCHVAPIPIPIVPRCTHSHSHWPDPTGDHVCSILNMLACSCSCQLCLLLTVKLFCTSVGCVQRYMAAISPPLRLSSF